MVIVDTCIWSTALRRKQTGQPAPEEALILQKLIRQHRAVMIGPILQEVLSGIRHEEQFSRLKNKLEPFELLSINRAMYTDAARLSNQCRTHGIQGSHTDFLIAAASIKHNVPILTSDQDFL